MFDILKNVQFAVHQKEQYAHYSQNYEKARTGIAVLVFYMVSAPLLGSDHIPVTCYSVFRAQLHFFTDLALAFFKTFSAFVVIAGRIVERLWCPRFEYAEFAQVHEGYKGIGSLLSLNS